MAELTASRRDADAPDAPASGSAGPAGPAATATPPVIDPRAVRVQVGPTTRIGTEPVLRVAPPAEPLRMANPTVGRGPLGGAALPDGDPLPDPVRAQRQPVVDDEPSDAFLHAVGRGRHVLDEGGRRTRVVLEPVQQRDEGGRHREVLVDGFRFDVEVESERIAALRERASRGRAASAHSGPLAVKAIIPGKVVAVSIAAGDAVTAGQQLLVVEAMKMQNELRSPRDGTIERVGVAVGVNIEVGDLLVVIS